MERYIAFFSPLLHLAYRFHDGVSGFLLRHIFGVKRVMLIVAHLSLFGFLFPEIRRDFGELAANLLILILFISPLSKIFRMRLLLQLMMLRRELGILMGYLATVHGVGYLLDPDWYNFIMAPILTGDIVGNDPRYFFGIVAYLLTLPLLFTSNALAQKYMGVKWKQLHRSVYLMFAFAIIHRFLIQGAPAVVLIEIAILLGAYGLVKVLAWRNFFPPLVKAINLLAEDHRRFTQSAGSSSLPR